MQKNIICNTSPLLYLHRLGCIEILKELFKKIVIPQGVLSEIEFGKTKGKNVPEIKDYPWIEVKEVSVPDFIGMITDLGKGEAEVLSLACEMTNCLVIIDDNLGRRIARVQDFKITGTIGILFSAKEAKLIKELKPLLNKLQEIGFYLGKEIKEEALRKANEL